MNPKLKAIFNRIARAIAFRAIPIIERRACGRSILRRFPVGRKWLVEFTTGDGRHSIARIRQGIFDLDLTDDVQRALFYRCYENEELNACLAIVNVGDIVIDVGANVGAYTVPLAQNVGTLGSVHSFEPVPAIAEQLWRNCKLTRCQQQVRLSRVALSDAIGPTEFFGASAGHSGWGSLERFDDLDPTPFRTFTTTLSNYVKINAIPHVRLIKLDVEGHEMSVIAGGAEVLREGIVDFILVEGNERRLSEAGHSTRELCDTLATLGFILQAAFPKFEAQPPGNYCGNLLFRWVFSVEG